VLSLAEFHSTVPGLFQLRSIKVPLFSFLGNSRLDTGHTPLLSQRCSCRETRCCVRHTTNPHRSAQYGIVCGTLAGTTSCPLVTQHVSTASQLEKWFSDEISNPHLGFCRSSFTVQLQKDTDRQQANRIGYLT